MFVMPLAAAMVLSAVPAFASEGTSSAAEETVEETSEASSAEESESEGVGDVLANLEGTYEELFPVIADAKYDDLWLGFWLMHKKTSPSTRLPYIGKQILFSLLFVV